MFKKLTLFSLIVVLFISFINTNFAYATPQDKINESLKKYQTLDSEILELNSKIESLDIEIDKTTLKLKENNQAISDIKNQIEINESKLKQTKENLGFSITNINFVKRGNETILTARVTNNTGTEQGSFFGKIVLLDKSGKEIGIIPVMISETQNGEAIDIETSITESYANAYDFRLEK